MQLSPRPILTEKQLVEMESRASPMFESTRRQFELYRACASDVYKRQGKTPSYYHLRWLREEPHA